MILITGGLGYIGSHTAAALVQEGHDVVVVDNLLGTRMEVLERLEYVTGKYITFVRQDVRNTPAMQRIFEQYGVTAVVHMAGMNANSESSMQPLSYYNCNVAGLLSVLRVMSRTGVRTLLHASTAAVYATNEHTEGLSEEDELDPSTPYARSADMCEQFLHDISQVENDWRIAVMRYFNVAGSHASHLLGDMPNGAISKLMPHAALVAQGTHETLPVYGDDFATPDGTCVRDYLHIQDAVEANMQALAYLHSVDSALEIFNIGSGVGSSVLEVVNTFSEVTGMPIETDVVGKRIGDISRLVADISYAKEKLQWQPQKNLQHICEDTWRFYEKLLVK